MSNLPSLTNGAAATIKLLLEQPEWYSGRPVYIPVKASSVLDKLDHLDSQQKFATESEASAWSKTPYTLELEPKEIEAVKIAVEFFLGKGAIRLSRDMVLLIKDLGITGE